MANPGRIVAGYIALLAPVTLMIFGLVAAVVIGWRNWLRLPKKKPPRRNE